MTGERAALRLAINLVKMPSRVRHIRSCPLPDSVSILLCVAAGDEAATARAARLAARPNAQVQEAAAFFIEQILLAPGADSYRVLGATPSAAASELRRNMILLLRWLHPDLQGQAERSVFAGRVLLAWSDLKTPARRAAYDEAQRLSQGLAVRRFKTGAARNAPARPRVPVRQTMQKKITGDYASSHASDLQGRQRRLLRALLSCLRG